LTTAIRFDHVSKRFTLHYQRPRSFQELAIQLFRGSGEAPERQLEKIPGVAVRGREEFWALRDVSFTVDQGETVGIIGPNGAGKSTALKLISRIIPPTSGDIEVNGRVGALLELGAGFHPDLSGRENVYLNGSILGLTRVEIDRKLDEIIAFAELERFIDMPVKHYSSGMRMRLGFSIAAHIDPEILLVDEVLAVGDQNFQHKCLEHITEMQREGVTICFVSHDLGSVRRLCSRALWLNDGAVCAEGRVDDVVSAYLRHAATEEESRFQVSRGPTEGPYATRLAGSAGLYEQGGSTGTEGLQILDVSLLNEAGTPQHIFRVGEFWAARWRYRSHQRIEDPKFSLTIHRNDGLCVCGACVNSTDLGVPFVEGEGTVLYQVKRLPLMEGTYTLSVASRNQAGTVTFDELDRLHTFKTRQVGSGERYGLAGFYGRWEWQEEEGRSSAESSSEYGTTSVQRYKGHSESERRWGVGDIRVVSVSFLDRERTERRVFETGEPWTVRLRYRARRRVEDPVFGLAVHRDDGVHVCGPNTHFAGLDIPFVEYEGDVFYRVGGLPLMEGTYLLSVSVHNRADTVMYDYHDRLYAFRVCQFGACEKDAVITLSGEWVWAGTG
jgi:lipopolysaccharide transport system ATP-binding protein